MKRMAIVAASLLVGAALPGLGHAQQPRPWHNPDLVQPGPGAAPNPPPRAAPPREPDRRPEYRPDRRPGYRPGPSPRYGVPPGQVHRERRRPPSHAEWRRGRWHHGRHNGRTGWWWVVGGTWFLFSQPVYPAPPYVYTPPTAPYPPVQYYYYCYNPPGYYPNIPACPGGWYSVPATPPRAY